MAYETAAALRQALEVRLAQEAHDRRIDLNWLRRRVVFERILVRLDAAEPGCWVLKGGMALEVRLRDRARTTRDLDLVLREQRLDVDAIRRRLIEALQVDPDADRFAFVVGRGQPLQLDAVVGQGARYSIEASLAGRSFGNVHLDVAGRPEEARRTERLPLPGTLAFAGKTRRTFEVVSAQQQFAEKLHALTRDYGQRENSRVRDLVDLLLLIEGDFLERASLADVVEQLFTLRSTHAVPQRIPPVPASWESVYARTAADLAVEARTLSQAIERLDRFWQSVISVH